MENSQWYFFRKKHSITPLSKPLSKHNYCQNCKLPLPIKIENTCHCNSNNRNNSNRNNSINIFKRLLLLFNTPSNSRKQSIVNGSNIDDDAKLLSPKQQASLVEDLIDFINSNVGKTLYGKNNVASQSQSLLCNNHNDAESHRQPVGVRRTLPSSSSPARNSEEKSGGERPVSASSKPWTDGNSNRRMPDYYTSSVRIKPISEIDEMYMIKDDLFNYRKLSDHQKKIIRNMNNDEKTIILEDFMKVVDGLIDAI